MRMKEMTSRETYVKQGEAAARQGLTREDCPYNEAEDSHAWNLWVYGNEIAQGEMVKDYMTKEGTPLLYMTTAPLTDHTRQLLTQWEEQVDDAAKRMRSEKGWKP
jgi:hypothetical protein